MSFSLFKNHVRVGCNLSATAQAIYAKRDSYEVKMVRGIIVIGQMMVLLSYLPPVFCWLWTIVFGVPSVDFWALPLASDEG